MTFQPIATLLTDQSRFSRESIVAFGKGEEIDLATCQAQVCATIDSLRKAKVRRALLFAEDTYKYVVGLLALLHSGCEAVIAPNLLSPVLESLRGQVDCILGDAADGTGLPHIEIGRASGGGTLGPIVGSTPLITLLTSGSSGQPKKVGKSIEQFEREAEALSTLWAHQLPGSRVQAMVPHHHMYGLTFKVFWPLMSGHPFHRSTCLYWEDMLQSLVPGAFVISSPAHLERIGGIALAADAARPSAVLSAGAPLDQKHAELAMSVLGCPIWEIFGSTEAGAIAWRDRKQEGRWIPVPGVSISAPNGVMRLNSVHAPDVLDTTDKITMDAAGGFTFAGRADRTVKVEGMRVDLGSLELAAIALDEVEDAAVFVRQGENSTVSAAVVLSELGQARLTQRGKFRFQQYLKQQLSKKEASPVLPRRWRFVNEIPTTSLGKRNVEQLSRLFDDPAPANWSDGLEVIAVSAEGDHATLDLRLTPDAPCLIGHFPEYPVMPGIVQLQLALKFAREHLGIAEGSATGLKVKYRQVLQPNTIFSLKLHWENSESRLAFEYSSEAAVYSSGTCVVAAFLTPVAIIPTFNHYRSIDKVVDAIRREGLPVIVIDDGSNSPAREAIAALEKGDGTVRVLRRAINGGKGAAVCDGLLEASRCRYTHVVQIDADGQHDLGYLPALLEKARAFPDALVTGIPCYDASISKSRKIARYITHVWVWIETLSLAISDSMCGFRVYPLGPTLRILERVKLGRRMDFDPEIMVRLFWAGVRIVEVPVAVTYPVGNTSNFHVVADNVLISRMHTRLFFGMLPRIPMLLARRFGFGRKDQEGGDHWSNLGERGMGLGLSFLVLLFRLIGYRGCQAALAPIVTYFWLTGRRQRRSADAFLERALGRPPEWRESLRLFRSFGRRCLDVFAGWTGRYRGTFDYSRAQGLTDLQSADRGLIVVVSHLGNVELLRAQLEPESRARLVALVHTRHAVNFNRALSRVCPTAFLNTVQVTDVGPDTLFMLQERIERGEWIAIAGDRTPVTGNRRVSQADFLGFPANFPQGPYLLAGLLRCPVYTLFSVEEVPGERHSVYFEKLADPVVLPGGAEKDKVIDHLVVRYAQRLEGLARRYPMQWFNFFDFWRA